MGFDVKSGNSVLVGHVIEAYGLKGLARIRPYSAQASALLHSSMWWLCDRKAFCHHVQVVQAKKRGDILLVCFEGVTDRMAVDAFKGMDIYIERECFPPLAEDEYYWVDLIGLCVENMQGQSLGQVTQILECGAHPVLNIVSDVSSSSLLIPFVVAFVKVVDQTKKIIQVDWEASDDKGCSLPRR